MREIIIITHSNSEIEQLVDTKAIEGRFKKASVVGDNRCIRIYERCRKYVEDIKSLDPSNSILIHHGISGTDLWDDVFKKWNGRHNDVGSASLHRQIYDEFLNSSIIKGNLVDDAFDTTWDYFAALRKKQSTKSKKVQFLNSILNGEKIDRSKLPDFVKEIEEKISDALDYFSENSFSKNNNKNGHNQTKYYENIQDKLLQ